MKTPAPLSKAFALLAVTAAFLRRTPERIFGNISWRPPRWLSRIGENWRRLERAYPRAIAPAILAIFAILCAGAWTWNWYSHLPKPHRVTVKITPVEVTKLEKDLKFPRLTVYFSESAARLDDLKKPSIQGVELQPHVLPTHRAVEKAWPVRCFARQQPPLFELHDDSARSLLRVASGELVIP